MHVAADGTVTDVWTGLTTVTGVGVGTDGSLFALEMSTGNLDQPPFLVPGSGRLVHQTGPDSFEVVADSLMLPVAMDAGSDGAFYVSLPAIGAGDGSGVIVRISLDGSSAATEANPNCAPIPETLFVPGTPEAAPATPAPAEVPVSTPVAEVPVSTPAAVEVTEASPESSPVAQTADVSIENFSFAPQTLEISAGTTVVWTNNDTTAHTATADDATWDTGNIDPGASASITFDTPGTYTYKCAYHPSMTATIIVSKRAAVASVPSPCPGRSRARVCPLMPVPRWRPGVR
jgi:plastocyanin